MEEKVESPKHSTGPTSPEGKAKSSMNRLTHGCRSAKSVLPDEDPAEFEFTVESWRKAYDPQDPTAATLVFETARAQWIFQRNQHRLDEIESRLPADAWHWNDTHINLYNNFSRYKTTAERSFYRAFNNLEAHYKREAAKERRVIQWGEVVTNSKGECLTALAPNNAQLAALANSEHPPEFITRFISFTNGVPPAYEWANPNDLQRCTATLGMQQFTYEGWLRQIEAERVAGNGHLQPYTTGLLDS